MPKGLEPLLPIYQRGILYGNATIREVAASGLGELIQITSNKYLAGPFIIKMTGPLLRIVGDRNPPAVKVAIVKTLGLILIKGGPALRAFVPQFQTTFVKALSDPSRLVRVEATKALALLMPLSTRIDPLIKELVSGSRGNGANAALEAEGAIAVQTATLEALSVVLTHGGKKAKLPDSIPSALEVSKELFFHEVEGIREMSAKVFGVACALLGGETAVSTWNESIKCVSASDSDAVKHGKVSAAFRILASGAKVDSEVFSAMISMVKVMIKDKDLATRKAACIAIGTVAGSLVKQKNRTLKDVERIIINCMEEKDEIEVYQSLARGLCAAVRMDPNVFKGKEGLPILDGALKLAMGGTQRIQLAFNDFLWLALMVGNGEKGLNAYLDIASFENGRTMKNLTTKVLSRIKVVEESIVIEIK